jgi:S-(hydroxymethyl)glutathione dehydrogenase / alcohol dehydrogenase
MRAAVLTEINTPLQILDLDQEPPKGGEVRVRVKAAGVCMSDWHIMNGDWPLPLPMVLGHEAAGIVIECGPGVDHVETGDHVIFSLRPLPLLLFGPDGAVYRAQRYAALADA